MAKRRKFTIGKTAVDLDKIEVKKPGVIRRVRCSACSYRFSLPEGQLGEIVFAQCPNCLTSAGYKVPAVNVI
jgi:hypothetical protein